MFKQFTQHSMRDGSINYKEFMAGIKDGKLPEEKITEVMIKKVFVELKANEQYALDFRAFLILFKYKLRF
jgi:hypothetical protein